jgi:hypothetical protein
MSEPVSKSGSFPLMLHNGLVGPASYNAVRGPLGGVGGGKGYYQQELTGQRRHSASRCGKMVRRKPARFSYLSAKTGSWEATSAV